MKKRKEKYNTYIFGGFPVAGMKKNDVKKKNAGSRLGYCPFTIFSHDTVDYIMIKGLVGQ